MQTIMNKKCSRASVLKYQKYRRFHLVTQNVFGSSQWAHHGQTTLKQRCIDIADVDTTLFRRRLTMTCPLG